MAEISGTTVFTGERSQRGYRLNKLAMSLTDSANRERFRADETGYMRAQGLTEAEVALVRARDWSGLIDAGGSVYLMVKIAGTLGQGLLDVGAQMRGQALAELRASLPGLRGH